MCANFILIPEDELKRMINEKKDVDTVVDIGLNFCHSRHNCLVNL